MTSEPGRRFCRSCGRPLSLGDRFCGECGTPVGASVPEPTRDPAEADVGERRQVTILFADLSGFTELSRTLDPEDVHNLLERYFELVDQTVARFGEP